MAFLDGRRSQFAKNGNVNIDNIIELYDLPANKQVAASRYKTLLSKSTLTTEERQELNQLTIELQDYIITAEKWNFFGDVIINIQTFFKDNVFDFVINKKQEIIEYVDDKMQNLNQFVLDKKQEMITFGLDKMNEFQAEIDKFNDTGEYLPTKQYFEKNICRHDGNVYLCIKDGKGKHPTNIEFWMLLTIKGDTGYGVGVNPRGLYSPATNYIVDDLVNYNGNLYRCIKPSNNIYPSNQEYWTLFLSGNGEILNELETDHKESLVGAINEVSNAIPTKVSELENDEGYLVESSLPDNLATTDDIPEVIDDLNTEDSDKILSARQGKILNDSISELQNDNIEIKDEVFNNSNSILNIKQILELELSYEKGMSYKEFKDDVTNIWTTEIYKNDVKVAEKIDYPKNEQGEYIVVINLYEDGVITETITITEWKDGTDKWIKEVV